MIQKTLKLKLPDERDNVGFACSFAVVGHIVEDVFLEI